MARCIVVLGMHRSGTSALAGLLHTNGIKMGEEFYPPPLPENPYGFFEDYAFRSLNDLMLSENGYNVTSFSPHIPKIFSASRPLREQMKSLIASRTGLWGFKDPRTLLTIHLWAPYLPKETTCIWIHREAEEVAKSLVKRGNCSHAQGLELTSAYKSAGEMYLRQTCFIITHITFSALLNNTTDVAKTLYAVTGKEITNLAHIRKKNGRDNA